MVGQLPRISQADGETWADYSARVLSFVIETGVTATLCDVEIEQAIATSVYVLQSPDMSDVARERLTKARRILFTALEFRRFLHKPASSPFVENLLAEGSGGARVPVGARPKVGGPGGAPAAHVNLDEMF